MAFLTNPAIAIAVVAAQQRRHSNWADLTVDQLAEIRQVIRDDQRGRLTRDDVVTRLLAIGGHPLPDQAA